MLVKNGLFSLQDTLVLALALESLVKTRLYRRIECFSPKNLKLCKNKLLFCTLVQVACKGSIILFKHHTKNLQTLDKMNLSNRHVWEYVSNITMLEFYTHDIRVIVEGCSKFLMRRDILKLFLNVFFLILLTSQEAHLQLDSSKKEPFQELNRILEACRCRNLDPALEYVYIRALLNNHVLRRFFR
jgi:hypothetical protein